MHAQNNGGWLCDCFIQITARALRIRPILFLGRVVMDLHTTAISILGLQN